MIDVWVNLGCSCGAMHRRRGRVLPGKSRLANGELSVCVALDAVSDAECSHEHGRDAFQRMLPYRWLEPVDVVTRLAEL